MSIEELESLLSSKTHKVYAAQGQQTYLKKSVLELEKETTELLEKVKTLDAASAFISNFADSRELLIHRHLEDIVSQGLQDIFGEDLRLKVEQKIVGKRVEVKFKLISKYGDQEVETDILSSRGGGVAAVCGFLLRVVMLLLLNREYGTAKLLVLDESFGQVSSDYTENVAILLEQLAEEHGVQIIMVTHDATGVYEEHSDTVYRSSSTDGTTQFRKVSGR